MTSMTAFAGQQSDLLHAASHYFFADPWLATL